MAPITPLRSNFIPTTTSLGSTSPTSTTTRTARTSGDQFVSGASSPNDQARRSATDAALSKLRGMSSFEAEGRTFDMNSVLAPGDLAAEMKPFEDRIQALYNQQPPLSPNEITAQSEQIMAEFQQYGAVLTMMVESMMMQIFSQSLPKPGFGGFEPAS